MAVFPFALRASLANAVARTATLAPRACGCFAQATDERAVFPFDRAHPARPRRWRAMIPPHRGDCCEPLLEDAGPMESRLSGRQAGPPETRVGRKEPTSCCVVSDRRRLSSRHESAGCHRSKAMVSSMVRPSSRLASAASRASAPPQPPPARAPCAPSSPPREPATDPTRAELLGQAGFSREVAPRRERSRLRRARAHRSDAPSPRATRRARAPPRVPVAARLRLDRGGAISDSVRFRVVSASRERATPRAGRSAASDKSRHGPSLRVVGSRSARHLLVELRRGAGRAPRAMPRRRATRRALLANERLGEGLGFRRASAFSRSADSAARALPPPRSPQPSSEASSASSAYEQES